MSTSFESAVHALHCNDKSMLASMSLVFAGALCYGVANQGLLLPAAVVAGLLLTAFAAAAWWRGGVGSQLAC